MNEIDKRFIGLYQEIGRAQGISDPLVTLFAKLYIEPGEIAMEELAKETGYSLASVSNQLKLFDSIVQVKKIRKPGSKKIFLYVDKSIVRVIRDQIAKKEEYGIRLIKERLPAMINEFKDKAKSDKDKKKMKIAEDYYKQILRCETIVREAIEKFDKLLTENEKR